MMNYRIIAFDEYVIVVDQYGRFVFSEDNEDIAFTGICELLKSQVKDCKAQLMA